MNDLIKTVISDLKKEGCILVLGPDIVDFNGKTFFESMTAKIEQDGVKEYLSAPPIFIFKNEELFQLQEERYESKMARFVQDFYSEQEVLNEPLRLISQIPFHLIITLMPDSRLENLFEEQNFPYNTSCYPRKKAPANDLKTPTQSDPLIYKLFGDSETNTSPIITFDQMFEFLVGIIGKRPLPDRLQIAIKKAKSFIFLGVQFEKWYSQLILKILTSNIVIQSPDTDEIPQDKYSIRRHLTNGENIEPNNSIPSSEESSKVFSFLAKRLSVDFRLNNPKEFIEILYEECKKHNLLKIKTDQNIASVFLSYSHKDEKEAMELADYLQKNKIKVIIDQTKMYGGQNIMQFIDQIKNVDVLIPILSAQSLQSKWVIKEISLAFKQDHIKVLPCYIDKSYLDENLLKNAIEMVDSKLVNIADKTKERGKSDINDLNHERAEWIEYSDKLPQVINEITKLKCLPINDNLSIFSSITKLIAKQ